MHYRYSDDKGNYLFAKNTIKEGEVLVVEKAPVFINIPNCSCVKATTFRCHHCSKVIFEFVPCRNCDICLFCNDNCRHAAWIQYHRFECYGLQRHFWENDVSFTALRTLLLGIDTEDFLFGVINSSAKHISAYRYIYNSESHMVQKSTKELNVILHQSARTLIYLIEKTNFFNFIVEAHEPNFKKLYNLYVYMGGLLLYHGCQASCNAVDVPIKDFFGSVGYERVEYTAVTMCPTVAMFNHSCEPNAVIIPNNDTLIVKALRAIQKDEEITISYYPITHNMSFSERSAYCNKKHFTCKCKLCELQKPFNIFYSCLKCQKVAVRKVDLVICCTCGHKCPFSEVQPFLLQRDSSLDKYVKTRKLHHLILSFNLHRKVYGPDQTCVYNELFLSCLDEFDRREDFVSGCTKVLEGIKYAEDTFNEAPFAMACKIYPLLQEAAAREYFTDDPHIKSNLSVLMEKLVAKAEMVIKIFEIYYPERKINFLKQTILKYKKYME